MPPVAMLLCSEVVVDWVKHAFITKFNCISSEVCQRNVRKSVYSQPMTGADDSINCNGEKHNTMIILVC